MFIRLFTFFRAVSFPGLAHRRRPSSCRGLCRSRSGRSLRLSPSGRPALHVGAVGFPRLQTACPQLGETPGLFPPPPTMLETPQGVRAGGAAVALTSQPLFQGSPSCAACWSVFETLSSCVFLWFTVVSVGRTNLVLVTSSEMEAKVQSIYF